MWDLLNLIFCLLPYREVPLFSLGDSPKQCGFIICRNKTPKLNVIHWGEQKQLFECKAFVYVSPITPYHPTFIGLIIKHFPA